VFRVRVGKALTGKVKGLVLGVLRSVVRMSLLCVRWFTFVFNVQSKNFNIIDPVMMMMMMMYLYLCATTDSGYGSGYGSSGR
jgi:hypothetical protein